MNLLRVISGIDDWGPRPQFPAVTAELGAMAYEQRMKRFFQPDHGVSPKTMSAKSVGKKARSEPTDLDPERSQKWLFG